MTAFLELYAQVIGTILFGLFVAFIIFFVLLYRKTQVAMLLEQERMQQVLLRAEVEIREQTLLQVSRELHDNLGQLTSLISLNLKMLEMEKPEANKKRISETSELVGQLAHDIKNLTQSLNGDALKQFGWDSLLNREVERVKRTGLLDVRFSLEPSLIPKVPTNKVLPIYRVVQELFHNTLKHSQASLCTLVLEEKNHTLHMQYTDNGRGFDLGSVSNGNGLKNIQKRCDEMLAICSYKSKVGEGVLVDIYLPLMESLS